MKHLYARSLQKTLFVLLFVSGALFPFAHMRISLWQSSLSPLSVSVCWVLLCGAITYHAALRQLFTRWRRIWYGVGFFMVFTMVIAIITGSHHAVGIFIEWFLLPMLFGVMFFVIIQHTAPHVLLRIGLWSAAMFVVVMILTYTHNSFTYDGRLQGLWPSPTHLAMLVAPLSVLLLGRAWCYPSAQYVRSSFFLGSAFFIILLATQSVFGLMSFFVGMGFLLFVCRGTRREKRFRARSIVLGVLFLILGLGVVMVRHATFVADMTRSSFASRIVIWHTTRDIIAPTPLFAHGLGTFQTAYLSAQRYYPPYLEWAVPTPHNLYLMTYFSGGLVYLGVFLFLCFFAIWNGISSLYRKADKNAAIFLAAFISVLVHGIVDTPLYGTDLGYVFWGIFWGVIFYSESA